MQKNEEQTGAAPAFTNAAVRLAKFMSDLPDVNGMDRPVWKALAIAMLIPPDDHSFDLVVAAMALKIRDLRAIRLKLRHGHGSRLPPTALEEPLDHLATIFRTLYQMLNDSWKNHGHRFNGSLKAYVDTWTGLIDLDELVLPAVELSDLRTALQQARDSITGDKSLDVAFVRTLLELIDLLEAVINAYAYGGQHEVQKAFRSFFVAMYSARDELTEHESKPGVQAIFAALKYLKNVVDVAMYGDKFFTMLAHGQPLLEKIVESGPHLLGRGTP